MVYTRVESDKTERVTGAISEVHHFGKEALRTLLKSTEALDNVRNDEFREQYGRAVAELESLIALSKKKIKEGNPRKRTGE